jgi:hypothetical protein
MLTSTSSRDRLQCSQRSCFRDRLLPGCMLWLWPTAVLSLQQLESLGGVVRFPPAHRSDITDPLVTLTALTTWFALRLELLVVA